MRARLAAATILVAFLAQPAFAEFRHVARALESRIGKGRIPLPFLGLARVLVRSIHPNGVHDFQLAVWEGHYGNIGGHDVEKILQDTVGKRYTPMVRVYSAKRDEWTFIYASPASPGLMDLLIVAHEKTDTVVVRVVADVARVMRGFDEPVNMARIGRD